MRVLPKGGGGAVRGLFWVGGSWGCVFIYGMEFSGCPLVQKRQNFIVSHLSTWDQARF